MGPGRRQRAGIVWFYGVQGLMVADDFATNIISLRSTPTFSHPQITMITAFVYHCIFPIKSNEHVPIVDGYIPWYTHCIAIKSQ